MPQEPQDPVWNAAWDWVQREYDRDKFDDAARVALTQWLLADPTHRKAYEKASRLWLLAGFVPPADDLEEAVREARRMREAGADKLH